MRRPLAIFGFSVLAVLLVAAALPYTALLPLALLAAAVFLLVLVLRRRLPPVVYVPVLVALGGAAFALCWRWGYDALLLRPLRRFDGVTAAVSARVEDSQPLEGLHDTENVTLTIQRINGEQVRPFKVRLYMPPTSPGDWLEISALRFSAWRPGSTALSAYSKGQALSASLKGEVETVGQSRSPLTALRRLRNAAGDNIRTRLPRRLSAVFAAMTVGDRRTLPQATSNEYRRAGIAHLLVVSGLHMSVVSGAVYGLARRLFGRRRAAVALAMASVLGFMLLTGCTPSVVRSGVVWLLVYTAKLFGRKDDIITSMGLAALLLCLQNPYAARDAGLLLSFSATLGALAGAGVAFTPPEGWPPLAQRFATGGLRAACASLGASIALLPVQAYFSFGMSLLTLPVNLVAVPLLGVLVPCGFVMALPAGFSLLNFFVRPFALAGGALAVLLERLTQAVAAQRWAYITLSGWFFLVVLLLCGGLALLARHTGRRRAYAAGMAAVLLLAGGLHLALNAGTVTVAVAGRSGTPSLVVVQQGRAVVLYGGQHTLSAVQSAFSRLNVRECELLLDLRFASGGSEVHSLEPREIYLAGQQTASSALYQPLPDVSVYYREQGRGRVACVEAGGYKIGLVNGRVDLSAYAPLDVLVVGRGEAEGDAGLVLATETPDWIGERKLALIDRQTTLWVRPGKSMKLMEVDDGLGPD